MSAKGMIANTTIIAAFFLISTLCACCAENVIWQIGEPDNNFAEFAIAGKYENYRTTFKNNILFRVGIDKPAKSWPFIHPGPADPWAGNVLHPYVILFDLPVSPEGVFTLTIDFVSTHGIGPSEYEININGIKGSIALPRGTDDKALTDPSKGREYIFTLPFSASLLKSGENRITLTATTNSWAVYDALCLKNDPTASFTPIEIKDLNIVPTSRIIRVNNKLKRYIKVSAQLSRGMAVGNITMTSGSGTQQLAISSDINGLAQTDALIDDLPRPVQVMVKLTFDNALKTVSSSIPPGKRWKLYIIPASHVDVGYTDYQERVAEVHNDNTTHALDLCARYPEFKWNTEASWVEDNYLAMMPQDRKADFIKCAKEGRIGCSAIYGSMLTGLCSHESLIRDLYYAHGVAKQYDIPFDMALSCDVPTQVWTLPSILAGSGIRYFSAVLNYGRDDISQKPMSSPFYWEGPDGGRVLTWFAPMYGWAWKLGLTTSVEAAELKIDGFMRQFNTDDYACDAVLAYGAVEDNRPFGDSLASVIDEWNKRYVSPKVILCRGPEFFQYIEKNWKGQLPVISGDSGACWEDGAASSAVEAGLARRGKERLLTAEKLNALNMILGKKPIQKSSFDAAWKNAILWGEHTWGASCSVDAPANDQTLHQWKVKSAFSTNLSRQADELLNKGLDTLSKQIKASEPSVIVYNPLGWVVSGQVQANSTDRKPVSFRAENVPPLGYRVYLLKNLLNANLPKASFDAANLIMRNRFYTMQVDRVTGAVTSLRDNELNRELVDANAHRGLNQYVYITDAGSANARDVTYDKDTSPVRISVEDRPDGKVLIIKGSAYNTPELTSEILLHDDEKRIDFNNTLYKTETLNKESGYFAYPFNLSKPRFHVELPDGVLQPDTQTQPGGCMQWYGLQDFVALENDDCAITWTALDSPLVTLSDISNRYGGHSKLILDKSRIYAYVFTNIWGTNYKASQGGKMTFNFSLTSTRKYDPVKSSHFGQSVRNPLIAAEIEPVKRALKVSLPDSYSVCSVSQRNVIIQSVKRAESGEGFIIRLREIAGRKTTASVRFPSGKFKKAALCNLMEDLQSKVKIVDGKLEAPISAYGLATVWVK